ncbi:transposase [Chryseobacterium balustinum]|uniref:transposase n=1 Tax=Chryseobacterium balustinum TaxID=246 RepID=UPI0009A75E63|nr:transposase [Chryseobacterium balustinum]
MLLKIFFYGYLNNTYASRKLARAVKENIYFMWLSARLHPDFRTLNDFRESLVEQYLFLHHCCFQKIHKAIL